MDCGDNDVARYKCAPGSRYPLGATVLPDGVNFSIFSYHATEMELLLYETATAPRPFQVIRLDPDRNRTYFQWHVLVEYLPEGTYYTWRADGPKETERSGCRFNSEIELLDPWARCVSDELWKRRTGASKGGVGGSSMRAVAVAGSYDWQGDRPLDHPLENSIIYELHVRGFTRHPSSAVKHPGAFAGLVEKIPYLKELGVTDVELMPVAAFDEQDVPEAAAALGLRNYWGYSPHSFFSPHPRYCVNHAPGSHVREFRDMVKAFHKAGIGVILDVVLNHTAEGGADGPVINFKGMANAAFYHLDPNDRSRYRDFTGCGNTINCNHPLVAAFLVECLEYWVREMHVDGFRFDLASVLVRGEDGSPMVHAPVVWAMEFSEILLRSKLIAEAWDAAGLYQVGAFPGFRWAEWNGSYRDVIRGFVKGDQGLLGRVASRIAGSSDLYQASGRLPINSVNFVTCHDGFTLYDLVSYNGKHNEANGENNRDGSDHNLSWNCGREGPTEHRPTLEMRLQSCKNFMAILLLSRGVPMILGGDEVLRTQQGNNNAYCQDNPLSWFDWDLTEKNREMLRFVREMILFRKRHPCLTGTRFLNGTPAPASQFPDVAWHGVRLHEPLWHDPTSRILAFTLGAVIPEEEDVHVILNMSDETVDAALPVVPGLTWVGTVDTSREYPGDILAKNDRQEVSASFYRAAPRSVVVLEGSSRSVTC